MTIPGQRIAGWKGMGDPDETRLLTLHFGKKRHVMEDRGNLPRVNTCWDCTFACSGTSGFTNARNVACIIVYAVDMQTDEYGIFCCFFWI